MAGHHHVAVAVVSHPSRHIDWILGDTHIITYKKFQKNLKILLKIENTKKAQSEKKKKKFQSPPNTLGYFCQFHSKQIINDNKHINQN